MQDYFSCWLLRICLKSGYVAYIIAHTFNGEKAFLWIELTLNWVEYLNHLIRLCII
jgi:hypothetical protein